jgi:ELWxxDGT repeat protein
MRPNIIAALARAVLVSIVVLSAATAIADAASPSILNINSQVVPVSSLPEPLGMLNGKLLFCAHDAAGLGLWSTDNTAVGTQLLARLSGGGGGLATTGDPAGFMKGGSRNYFTVADGTGGGALWATDGTATGTTKLVIFPGSAVIAGILGSRVLLRSVDASNVWQMYVTDGTQAGTQALTNVAVPGVGVAENVFVAGTGLGAKAYFSVTEAVGHRMFVTDGTVSGTHEVSSQFPSNSSIASDLANNPRSFQQVDSHHVLYTAASLLWSLDPATDTVTSVVSTTGTAGFGPPHLTYAQLILMNGYVLFRAERGALSVVDLWRSDGTAAGTYAIGTANVNPTFNESAGPIFEKVGDRVVFVGNDGTGSQLYSSDGTSIVRLTNASMPANWPFQIASPLATLGGIGYFKIADGASSTTVSIWRTDGTPANTRKIAALPPVDVTYSTILAAHGDGTIVYFQTPDVSTDTQSLVKYDPVTDQTTLLAGHQPYSLSDGYFVDAGRLYFSPNDSRTGYEPWTSDGTVAGTYLIKDLNPQVTDGDSAPDWLTAFDGRVAFAANDGLSGRELWISDGTTASTTLVADLMPGQPGSTPEHPFVGNGALYFFAQDKATSASALMRLAAGSSTPQVLAPLSPELYLRPPPSPYFSSPCTGAQSATVGNKTFFAANDGRGLNLWVTDGTSAGTHIVPETTTGGSGVPCGFTVFGNRVFFTQVDTVGVGLWATDGTDAGTVRIGDIARGIFSGPTQAGLTLLGNQLYFLSYDAAHGNRLWKTDGTPAGTALAVDFSPGAITGYMAVHGVLNGKLLVEAAVAVVGSATADYHLWVSDGTQAGSTQLGVVFRPSALPTDDFVISGDKAYFASEDGTGFEPWVTDGTVGGTRMLKDINPSGDSNPTAFISLGAGIAVFTVTDPVRRTQLWRTDGTTTGTVLISDVPPPVAQSYFAAPQGVARLAVGQHYFFIANDPTRGIELFSLADDLPQAAPDSGTSADGATALINVLANDTDSDGVIDNSTVKITTSPSHGTVTVGITGTLSYTPTSGYAGTDTFAYTVSDNQGGASSPTAVTVTSTIQTVTVGSGAGGTGGEGANKGGGGAMGFLDALALALALMAAMHTRARWLRHSVQPAQVQCNGVLLSEHTRAH